MASAASNGVGTQQELSRLPRNKTRRSSSTSGEGQCQRFQIQETYHKHRLILSFPHSATMLLEEDPATLIHHTIGNFNIQPDKLAITRINDSLASLQQARDLRVRDADISLRKLARTLHTLEAQHEELVSSHDPAKHASLMVELDTQKFRVAKAASDLELENEKLRKELDSLEAQLAELEEQGVEGDEAARKEREANDATVLRLKIYRNLGIEAETDEDGNYTKAVIRDSQKGDVHVVNIDPKFSRFFYANYFWQTMQG